MMTFGDKKKKTHTMAGSIPNAHKEHLIMLLRKCERINIPELPVYGITRMAADLFLAMIHQRQPRFRKYQVGVGIMLNIRRGSCS